MGIVDGPNKIYFMLLENKTIVITGGTSGIGYEIVKRLHANNKLLVVARTDHKLTRLKSEFPNIKTFCSDLSIPQGPELLVDTILKSHEHIDILINNAAIQHTASSLADDFSYDTIIPEIQLNFTSVCAMSYLFLPSLLDSKNTSLIVNINTGLALTPKESSSIYCATKAAMDSFSRSLAYQLESANVKVIQAFLPLVDTPMTTGRGKNKMSAEDAAKEIIRGIEKETKVNDIGKVKLLRLLMCIAPMLARKIIKAH